METNVTNAKRFCLRRRGCVFLVVLNGSPLSFADSCLMVKWECPWPLEKV
jgi:hypothetical protein